MGTVVSQRTPTNSLNGSMCPLLVLSYGPPCQQLRVPLVVLPADPLVLGIEAPFQVPSTRTSLGQIIGQAPSQARYPDPVCTVDDRQDCERQRSDQRLQRLRESSAEPHRHGNRCTQTAKTKDVPHISDAVRVRCTRGAYTGVVAWTVSAKLEAACCWRLCFCPKLHLTLRKELGQPNANWDRCAIMCYLSANCCTGCM